MSLSIYDVTFLVQFSLCITIILLKLYNIFSFNPKKKENGLVYSIRMSVLLLISYFLFWGIGFVTYLLQSEQLLYLSLFKLQTWFILFNILFFAIEIFYYMRDQTTKPIEAYMSNKTT